MAIFRSRLQPLYALMLLGLIGLLAALRRCGHHLHSVDRVSQRSEGDIIAAQVKDGDPALLYASLPVLVLNNGTEGDTPEARHDAKDWHFVKHEDGSFGSALKFDARQLGLVAHNRSSINAVRTSDVALATSVAPITREAA